MRVFCFALNITLFFILISLLILTFFYTKAIAETEKSFNFATFDPVGTHLFNPIEKKIPNLNLAGFIRNHTVLELHDKKNDFQKIEWLAELEAIYFSNSNTKWVAIVNFLYDAIFDWDERDLFPDGTEREIRHYRSSERIFREFYVETWWRDWNLTIGKQQVIWGKVEGRKVLDMIHPKDLRDFFYDDMTNWEYTNVPLGMVNLTYFGMSQSFQFLWIPDLEGNLLAKQDWIWQFKMPGPSPGVQVITRDTENPSDSKLKDHKVGFRTVIQKEGWEINLNYYYTWSDNPVYFREETIFPAGPPTPADPIKVILKPERVRLHKVGGAVEKQFSVSDKPWTFKMETVRIINDFFGNSQEGPTEDGQTKKDWQLTSLAMETNFFVDWLTTFTAVNAYYPGDIKNLTILPIARNLHHSYTSYSINISKNFWQDDANLKVLFVIDEWGNGRWRPKVTYRLTNFFTIDLGLHIFWGAPDDSVGQFSKNDYFDCSIKYSF